MWSVSECEGAHWCRLDLRGTQCRGRWSVPGVVLPSQVGSGVRAPLQCRPAHEKVTEKQALDPHRCHSICHSRPRQMPDPPNPCLRRDGNETKVLRCPSTSL